MSIWRKEISNLFIIVINEDTNESNGKKKYNVALLRKGGKTILASKSFLWSEKRPPVKICYDENYQMLCIEGKCYIVRIPLRIDRLTNARLACTASTSSPIVYNSFFEHESITFSQLTDLIRSLINKKNSNASLKKLQNFIDSNCILKNASPIYIALNSNEQQMFLNLIINWMEKDGLKNVNLLNALLRQRIFNEPNVCMKLMDFLFSKGYIDVIINIIESFALLDDNLYVHCLRLAMSSDFKRSILQVLLKKSFTGSTLSVALRKNLPSSDAISFIEELILLIQDKKFTLCLNKILELLSVFMDSYSQIFIWENNYHERIQKASQTITDLTDAIDLFNTLHNRIMEYKKSSNKISYPQSDYFVLRITFNEKAI